MESIPEPQASIPINPNGQIVGREADLAQLDQCLTTALSGERQLVFVTGEPGIGKTTLAALFVAAVSDRQDLWIGHGQCIEQYGAGEAYLPILEALNRLCQEPGGDRLIEVLRQHAPTWLIQLPSLVAEADREALQRQIQGTTQERMLREMAEALTVLTAEHGLVLVLEDLHWSDAATLELLAYLARRQEPAQLFIIGTYRTAEVQSGSHPLKGIVRELRVRSQCQELPLAPLETARVEEYLTNRLNGSSLPATFSETISTRTGGNPLFIVNLVDYLTHQQVLVEHEGQWLLREDELDTTVQEVPDSLRQLIEKQIEHADEQDQQVLEVASVVGAEFSVAATAAGLQAKLEEIEECCNRLSRRGQFLQAEGIEEWPDGTLGERYSFRHALYQDVLYDRVREVHRVRLHRRIGLRKEAAYGDRASDIAAELAVHFERGRDTPKAIQYLELAGQNALQRSAEAEAERYLQAALRKLASVPASPERDQQELSIQIKLGTALMALRSWSAPEVGEVYNRARTLCQQLGQTPQLFLVLVGLRLYHVVRAEFATAYEVSQQLLQLAQQEDDTVLLLEAHHSAGASIFFTGDYLRAKDHFEQALALYDPQQRDTYMLLYGQDPGISGLAYSALVLWALGYPDQARHKAEEALRLAHQFAHPFTLTSTLGFMMWLYQRYYDSPTVADIATEIGALSIEHGFVYWQANSTFGLGWELAQKEEYETGLVQMQQGLTGYTNTGAVTMTPWIRTLLADAYGRAGQATAGLPLIDEALAMLKQTGEYHVAAEVYRVKGELLLRQLRGTNPQSPTPNPYAEAEECFQQALDIARRQEAKSWELRTALSLGRLWQGQGKTDEAKQLLEDIYGWFTEGFETKDVQDTEALLKSLGSQVERTTRSEPAEALPQVSVALPAEKISPVPDPLPPMPPQAHTASASVLESPPETPPAAEQSASASIFHQDGDYWTVAFEGQTCRVKNVRGMHHLAQLLHNPNEEFHVLTLTGEAQPNTQPASLGAQRSGSDSNTEAFQQGFTDSGEVLDPEARAAYRTRMQELQTELEEAREFNDLDRAERIQEEVDFLSKELSLAVGLGGRARKTNSPAERARSTVTKSIKLAIKRIEKSHPTLGDYLANTIRTGTFCCYTPDPHVSLTWQG